MILYLALKELVLEKSLDYTEDSDTSSVLPEGTATRNTSSPLILKQGKIKVKTFIASTKQKLYSSA